MTGAEFAALRIKHFTVSHVARAFGLDRRTIQRLESRTRVEPYYVFALLHLIHEKEMNEIFPFLSGAPHEPPHLPRP